MVCRDNLIFKIEGHSESMMEYLLHENNDY